MPEPTTIEEAERQRAFLQRELDEFGEFFKSSYVARLERRIGELDERIAEMIDESRAAAGAGAEAPTLTVEQREEQFNRFQYLDDRIGDGIDLQLGDMPGSWKVFYGGTQYGSVEAANNALQADLDEMSELGARLDPYLTFSDESGIARLVLDVPGAEEASPQAGVAPLHRLTPEQLAARRQEYLTEIEEWGDFYKPGVVDIMRQRIAEIDAIIGPSTESATPAPPGEPEPLSEGERTELFDRFRALNARIDSDLTEVPIDESGDETVWKYGGTYYETEEDAWEAWHADVERHAEIGARLRPYLDFSDDPDEPKLRLLTPEELSEKQAADERDRSAVPGDTRGGLARLSPGAKVGIGVGSLALVVAIALGVAVALRGDDDAVTTTSSEQDASEQDASEQGEQDVTSDDADSASAAAEPSSSDGNENQAASLAAFLAAGLPAPPLSAGTTRDNVYTNTAPIPPEEVNFAAAVHLLDDHTMAVTLMGDLDRLRNSSWEIAAFDGDPNPRAFITGNSDIALFTDERLVDADPEDVLAFADAPLIGSDEVAAGMAIALILTEINVENGVTTIFIDGFALTSDGATAVVGNIFQQVIDLRQQGPVALPEISSVFKAELEQRPWLMILVVPGLADPESAD